MFDTEITICCHKDNTRKNQIERAINIINGVQSYFFYKLEAELYMDIYEEEYINWYKFYENYANTNNKPELFMSI